MTVWFTSDLHLRHKSIAFQRRYGDWPADKADVTDDDVAWHDDRLAAQWDAAVRPDDHVWNCGDLIANKKSLNEALAWIAKRPGIKHHLWGNHDPGHPLHSESHKWDDVYRTVFASVGSLRKRRILGREVFLSHFPYEDIAAGSLEGRYEQQRLPNLGAPIIHGHTHSKEKVTHAAGTIQIHVGVDAWDMAPVPLETITEILR